MLVYIHNCNSTNKFILTTSLFSLSVTLENLYFQTKTAHRHYTSQGTAGTISTLQSETKPSWAGHTEASAGHSLFRSGPCSSLCTVHMGSESSSFSDEEGNDDTSMLLVTELTFLQWLRASKHSWHFPFINSCNPYSVRKAILLLPPLLTPTLQMRKPKHSVARSCLNLHWSYDTANFQNQAVHQQPEFSR